MYWYKKIDIIVNHTALRINADDKTKNRQIKFYVPSLRCQKQFWKKPGAIHKQ